MDRRDDRRIHPLEPGDTAVQRGGPALDVRGKRGEIVDEGLDIAAIAESIALGGHEDAAHRRVDRKLRLRLAALYATLLVDRISAHRIVEFERSEERRVWKGCGGWCRYWR